MSSMAADGFGEINKGFCWRIGEELASALVEWLKKPETREALRNGARNAGKAAGAVAVTCATAAGSFIAANAAAILIGAVIIMAVGAGVYLVIKSRR